MDGRFGVGQNVGYEFGDEMTISGDASVVWEVWTDLARFPAWDPREEETRPKGPFAVGTTVWSKQQGSPGGDSTIVAIDPGRCWTVESSLPGGRLRIDHRVEPVGEGKVEVSKWYQVQGPLTLLFRFYYAPRIRNALRRTFAALEREAARRTG
ncbi:MAG: SRPBCC family protein [Chloroflexi bacterium]|nr:SRPBCC family protein [Chloroflexota bacterium]